MCLADTHTTITEKAYQCYINANKVKKANAYLIARCVVVGKLISFLCLDEFACRVGWLKEIAQCAISFTHCNAYLKQKLNKTF